jgi:hypothetical protein
MLNPSPEQGFFRGVYEGFKSVGHNIAALFNGIFLTIAYVIGVGPTTIVAWVVRKKFLDLRFGSADTTYWEDHDKATEPLDKYRRQF